MSTKKREYLELLKHAFNEEKFIEFIIDLLNLDISELNRNAFENRDIPNQYKESISNYKHIASYNDGMNGIGVFIIKLHNTTSTRARNLQRNFVAYLLKKYDLDGSLVSFYSDNEDLWRLSFVKKELSYTSKGVKEEITSAKRYSYLVGEGESVHTAQEYLFDLFDIDDRKITLSDIEKYFDVEKVTDTFFEEYKLKYLKLKEYLDLNEDFQTEATNCEFDSEEFAKKLMGQIVFLYFLQKKGWLGVQLIPNELTIDEYNELLLENDSVSQSLIKNYYVLNNDKYIVEKTKLRLLELQEDIINLSNIFKSTKYNMPWGTGNKSFIRYIFNQSQIEHKNFFDDYLEYFFYKGLNEKRENQYFALFNCKIPFLNGGLFEPLNNYRWSSAHFEIPNSLFSNDNKDGILDFLDLYNFTIDEEEPLEKDIAVDPEMLGKIFEKLLDIKEKESKGTVYTHRDIVFYMCQESLANYISQKLNIDISDVMQFIKYGDVISEKDIENGFSDIKLNNSILDNIDSIDELLCNIKIADPSVGSGAFPLGILLEIVKIRNNLTPYLKLKKYDVSHRDIFGMKLQTIENSIYAVDIEPSAVDITKLRLWLSLIVDYPNGLEPKPLPNLDCKIIQGNSLIDDYDGVPLFSKDVLKNSMRKNSHKYQTNIDSYGRIADVHIQQSLSFDNDNINYDNYIEEMLRLQKQYFSESNNKVKRELKDKISEIQISMVEESLKNDSIRLKEFKEDSKKKIKPWFIWELEFYDVFKENGGFDIVIGNPPYLESRNEKFSEELKDKLQNKMSKKYGKGQNYITRGSDLLIYFFELSLSLINKDGINMFITQNSWLDTDFGQKFQNYLLIEANPQLIIDSDFKQFKDSANINTIITLIKGKNNNVKNIDFIRTHKKFDEIMTSLSCINEEEHSNDYDLKRFKKGSMMIKNYKWGFLFNTPQFFINIIDSLQNYSNNMLNCKMSVGQGLNLTKDYVYDDSIKLYNFNSEALIPIYTVENNGVLRWNSATNYLVDKSKLDSESYSKAIENNINLFDSTRTTKVFPKLIMPRGVSNRYYSSFNECKGFSASYVDVYIDTNDETIIKKVWLFTNSSLFNLYREITGRNNLGGGMLKAEATDLKNIPLYYDFDISLINNVYEKAINYEVPKITESINSEIQSEIDRIVFDYFNIKDDDRTNIISLLLYLIEQRYNKSRS